MSSYIARPRKTSNALNATVRSEQKGLQRLSETVPANTRIPQAVRQGIQTDGPATTERLHLRAFVKFAAFAV